MLHVHGTLLICCLSCPIFGGDAQDVTDRELLISFRVSSTQTQIFRIYGDPDIWIPNLIADNDTNMNARTLSGPVSDFDFWDVGADYQLGNVFWYDGGHERVGRIFGMSLDSTSPVLLTAHSSIMDNPIAVDWVSKNVYWAEKEPEGKYIGIVSFVTKTSRPLVHTSNTPVAVAVAPSHRYIFWIEEGTNPSIKRASLDGRDIKAIVSSGMLRPTLLAIDYVSLAVYWVDAGLGRVQSTSFSGSGRRVVWSDSSIRVGEYAGMDLYKDYIFLAKTKQPSTVLLDKVQGTKLTALDYKFDVGELDPEAFHGYGITMMAPENQESIASLCDRNNGGCEQICIHDTQAYKCICEFGYTLQADGKTCTATLIADNFLLVTDTFQSEIYQVDMSSGDAYKLPVPLHSNPIAIGYHPTEKKIYWTDAASKVIKRASLDGSNEEVLVVLPPDSSPDGIALDFATHSVYFTDGGRGIVSLFDGTRTRVLSSQTYTGDEPRDIVLDIYGRIMYWTDWGTRPRIISANMDDGSQKRDLVTSDLGWPNGLAIDFTDKEMYWCDVKLNKIEKASLDGTNRRLLFEKPLGQVHFFGLAVDEQYLYFTDWYIRYVKKMHKQTLTIERIGPAFFGRPNEVFLYNSSYPNLGTTAQPAPSTPAPPPPPSTVTPATQSPTSPNQSVASTSEGPGRNTQGGFNSFSTTTLIIIGVCVGGVVFISMIVTVGVVVAKKRAARASQQRATALENPAYDEAQQKGEEIYLTPRETTYDSIRDSHLTGGGGNTLSPQSR